MSVLTSTIARLREHLRLRRSERRGHDRQARVVRRTSASETPWLDTLMR